MVGCVMLKVGKKVARKKAKQVGGKLTPWRSGASSTNDKNGKKSA